MNISIFGTGYVGLITGVCLAEINHKILCLDIDSTKIEQLKKGIPVIFEQGLTPLLKKHLKTGRIKFSTDLEKGIDFGDAIFNCVNTPEDDVGKANIKNVLKVAQTFGKFIDKPKIFINKSTVPVGTTELCKKNIEKEIKKRNANIEFGIASNPEFLREGCSIQDFLFPERILVGIEDEKLIPIFNKIYAKIINKDHPIIFMDIKSAEITKYASNAFLATKISFINEIANYCEMTGGNIEKISEAMGLDSRIGKKFLKAGIGYGGSCFPKDVKALIHSGKEHNYNFRIISAVEKTNEKQKTVIINKLLQVLPEIKNKKIAVWGLAFKPETDDTREAPSIKIVQQLLNKGAQVMAYDPVAIENFKKLFNNNNLAYSKNKYDCLSNADALLILTEWDEFINADLNMIHDKLKTPNIIDGRNVFIDKAHRNNKIRYIPIGIK